MIEFIVAIVGGAAGLFLFQGLTKISTNRRQAALEKEVAEIKNKAQQIQQNIEKNEKQTQEKVDEITKEQSIELVGNALANFFNNHKGK
jgi:uncharacterized protein YgiM (DUF1202 family)